MDDKVQEFLTAYSARIQRELTGLAEEIAFTKLVHTARGGVAGLADNVRQEVEDDVADILEII